MGCIKFFLVYDNYVNVLGDNIDTTEKKKGSLADGSEEVSLGVNTEKPKYSLTPCITAPLGKLLVAQLVRNSPAFYGSSKFVTTDEIKLFLRRNI
jgi:hypothetical protein